MQKNRDPNVIGDLALIRAEWFPIRLEPIRHSGERITIGVAVISEDPRLNKVVSTLPFDITKCLYRNRYEQLADIADISLLELREFLKKCSQLEQFKFSLGGVEIGPVRPIVEHSIDAMLSTAARLTSSLSATEPSYKEIEEKVQPWQKTVEGLITTKRPSLIPNFNRPLMVKNRQIATIGYVGNHFAANFYEIRNGRSNITNAMDKSVRRLIQIKSYLNKTSDHHLGFDWSGLILHKPELTLRESELFKRHMETLDMYADDLELTIRPVHHAEEAAELILDDAG